MNGRITIELGGVKTPLTFGMMAVEQFGKLQAIGSNGYAKMIVDLVFCGYCNEMILDGKAPELSYREVAEHLDQMLIDKDPVLSEVFKCFEESKAGNNLLEEVKKKVKAQQEAEQMEEKPKPKQPTGTKSKPSPSES